MVKVKICGITNTEDAIAACSSGADYIGFIFIKGTPRAVTKEKAKEILEALPKSLLRKVKTVGLFRDDLVEDVSGAVRYCALHYVQLQGLETPVYCQRLKKLLKDEHLRVRIMKAIKVKGKMMAAGIYGPGDYKQADYFVFDTFHPDMAGGTGMKFDWATLKKAKNKIKKPFFIAGGLGPGNVARAVKEVGPYGVDVSSGVESSARKKDENMVKEFIKNAKEAKSA